MELGLLIIHGVVGLLFAGHGAQKLFGWFGGAGLDRAGRAMEAHGLRPGKLMAAAAGAGEFGGGLLLALGLFTPLAAALLVALGLAFNGAGEWSLDAAIGWDVAGFWWGVASALVGLAGGTGVLGLRRRGSRASTAANRPAPAA